MLNRLLGVITLRAPSYRAIAEDRNATGQAALVVLVGTLLAGFFEGLVQAEPAGAAGLNPTLGLLFAIGLLLFGLLGWAIGAWVLAFVAKIIFHGRTNTLQMLRVTGFVHAFDLVAVLQLARLASPVLAAGAALVSGVVLVLRLIGYLIGVREAAGIGTGQAIVAVMLAGGIEFVLRVLAGGAIIVALLASLGLAGALR